MAEYLIQSETLDDIADAINAKTGGSSAMTPAEMVTAIGSISGGGGRTGEFTHLDTFELQENVASLQIDISDYDFKEYVIKVNATGTGADYLYVVPFSTGNAQITYINGNSYSAYIYISVFEAGTVNGVNIPQRVIGFNSQTNITNKQSVSNFTLIVFKAYRENGVLNAGGTFELYGR